MLRLSMRVLVRFSGPVLNAIPRFVFSSACIALSSFLILFFYIFYKIYSPDRHIVRALSLCKDNYQYLILIAFILSGETVFCLLTQCARIVLYLNKDKLCNLLVCCCLNYLRMFRLPPHQLHTLQT